MLYLRMQARHLFSGAAEASRLPLFEARAGQGVPAAVIAVGVPQPVRTRSPPVLLSPRRVGGAPATPPPAVSRCAGRSDPTTVADFIALSDHHEVQHHRRKRTHGNVDLSCSRAIRLDRIGAAAERQPCRWRHAVGNDVLPHVPAVADLPTRVLKVRQCAAPGDVIFPLNEPEVLPLVGPGFRSTKRSRMKSPVAPANRPVPLVMVLISTIWLIPGVSVGAPCPRTSVEMLSPLAAMK
jgi:hypothetical protein